MNNYEIIKIQGFDKDGEPEIKKFQDGHIELQFNFMPPLNGKADTEDSEFWDNFEQTLQSHLNVNVLRDDRELFVIEKNDSINKYFFSSVLDNENSFDIVTFSLVIGVSFFSNL